MVMTGVPKYKELITNGLGYYLHDPAKAPVGRVVYE
jgi:hypothetical protein